MVTGAALRVRERGITARREAQVTLAQRDERLAWEKIRAIHNVHTSDWDARPLNEDLELRVEDKPTSIDVPTDPKELRDVASQTQLAAHHAPLRSSSPPG